MANSEKAYLLLFKSGSPQSECAHQNLLEADKSFSALKVFYADVNKTRDIHVNYGVTSVPVLLEFEQERLKNVIKGCNNTEYYKALFDNALYQAETKGKEHEQKRVVVYSTPTCSWCNTLKAYLRKQRIVFTDIDVSKDQRLADELVRKSGQMGVPQTEIGGEIIVGFNKARINELLNIRG
ncbi:MAG TPA: NrdH-redoxin [Bacteroidetes bacterium]|nr:NrdH-redoxin [Bacteroidota bacterium]